MAFHNFLSDSILIMLNFLLKGNRYVKKNQLLTFGLFGENFIGIDIWVFFR